MPSLIHKSLCCSSPDPEHQFVSHGKKKNNLILSGQIPNLLSRRIKIYFLCVQKRRGLVGLLGLFSLLTDHELVISVTLLQLLACHLHCLKSKQDHLNLQLQYFSFHTSPVMLASQLCMLFCQCARSRRETSLLLKSHRLCSADSGEKHGSS